MNEPTLRVTHGDPSPEELAVLAAVLATAAAIRDADGPGAPVQSVRGRWNDPAHSVRRRWPNGPGGWRAAR